MIVLNKKINQITKKGFTLLELLIVIAIIGILASVVLVRLVGAREKAQWNNYAAYVSQVTKMTKVAVAGGYFDSVGTAGGVPACLGKYCNIDGCDTTSKCWSSGYISTGVNADNINNALSQVGTVPIGMNEPGSATWGVLIRAYTTFVDIYVRTEAANIGYCQNFGWDNVDISYVSYCRTRITK